MRRLLRLFLWPGLFFGDKLLTNLFMRITFVIKWFVFEIFDTLAYVYAIKFCKKLLNWFSYYQYCSCILAYWYSLNHCYVEITNSKSLLWHKIKNSFLVLDYQPLHILSSHHLFENSKMLLLEDKVWLYLSNRQSKIIFIESEGLPLFSYYLDS